MCFSSYVLEEIRASTSSYFFEGQYLKRKFLLDKEIFDEEYIKILSQYKPLHYYLSNMSLKEIDFIKIQSLLISLKSKIFNAISEIGVFNLFSITSSFIEQPIDQAQNSLENLNNNSLIPFIEKLDIFLNPIIDHLQYQFLCSIAENRYIVEIFNTYQLDIEYTPDNEDINTLFIFFLVSCKYSLTISELYRFINMSDYIELFIADKLNYYTYTHPRIEDLSKSITNDYWNKLLETSKNNIVAFFNSLKVNNNNYIPKTKEEMDIEFTKSCNEMFLKSLENNDKNHDEHRNHKKVKNKDDLKSKRESWSKDYDLCYPKLTDNRLKDIFKSVRHPLKIRINKQSRLSRLLGLWIYDGITRYQECSQKKIMRYNEAIKKVIDLYSSKFNEQTIYSNVFESRNIEKYIELTRRCVTKGKVLAMNKTY